MSADLVPYDEPVDRRHQFDEAKEIYDHPFRTQNERLLRELAICKAALREAGIEPDKLAVAGNTGSTMPSRRSKGKRSLPHLPHLPSETILKIMEFALISMDPIIDPLSKLDPEKLTVKERQIATDQIAIGFLATSRLFHGKGTRYLWRYNDFIFTSPAALRHFATLALEHRQEVHKISLRVIASIYDDDHRDFSMSRFYSRALGGDIPIKTHHPSADAPYGVDTAKFQIYAWSQLVDFLRALKPPYTPGSSIADNRPFLLPNLTSMRIDLVNFLAMSVSGAALRDLHMEASHNQPSLLHELLVTGIPCAPGGTNGKRDLKTLLKVDGLFLDGHPSYIQDKEGLRPLKGPIMNTQVYVYTDSVYVYRDPFEGLLVPDAEIRQQVPAEHGHPSEGTSNLGRETVWKRVPIDRDSSERAWVEFDRQSGYPIRDVEHCLLEMVEMDGYDSSDEADVLNMGMTCEKCRCSMEDCEEGGQ